jgi:NAD(P)-dependent dehydrogenase (short-subunit alcohol dehydrogenase family)
MRVVVIGATGTIGREIVLALEGRHDIVPVSHSKGEIRVDLSARDSIESLFAALEPFDALVCAAGVARFAPLEALTDADLDLSLANKLLGQIDLVRKGIARARDRGSFTLTSGVLASEPAPGSAAISPVNAGVEAFVRAAALEMPRGIRLNAVSPPWVAETLAAMGRDPSAGLAARKLAEVYAECVEGTRHGEVLDARKGVPPRPPIR